MTPHPMPIRDKSFSPKMWEIPYNIGQLATLHQLRNKLTRFDPVIPGFYRIFMYRNQDFHFRAGGSLDIVTHYLDASRTLPLQADKEEGSYMPGCEDLRAKQPHKQPISIFHQPAERTMTRRCCATCYATTSPLVRHGVFGGQGNNSEKLQRVWRRTERVSHSMLVRFVREWNVLREELVSCRESSPPGDYVPPMRTKRDPISPYVQIPETP
ncbi:hypothetical protein PR048_026203 [Dryococelus australis]|uniref:Uncharacterized protein n=1 Tax=Dryococelus australis TaxID=614101 RepID=A0ABQ9GKP8_9NEOP|nr:hypothetical protein PR048_026203 [Dryococelus australis]